MTAHQISLSMSTVGESVARVASRIELVAGLLGHTAHN